MLFDFYFAISYLIFLMLHIWAYARGTVETFMCNSPSQATVLCWTPQRRRALPREAHSSTGATTGLELTLLFSLIMIYCEDLMK